MACDMACDMCACRYTDWAAQHVQASIKEKADKVLAKEARRRARELKKKEKEDRAELQRRREVFSSCSLLFLCPFVPCVFPSPPLCAHLA